MPTLFELHLKVLINRKAIDEIVFLKRLLKRNRSSDAMTKKAATKMSAEELIKREILAYGPLVMCFNVYLYTIYLQQAAVQPCLGISDLSAPVGRSLRLYEARRRDAYL